MGEIKTARPFSDGGSPFRVRGIERTAAILFAFSRERPTLGLSELATLAGLDLATTLRYARGLVSASLLELRADGRYSLGFGILELAQVQLSQLDARRVALPVMRRIRDEVNETVLLSVRSGNSRVVIEQVEGYRDFRRTGGIGRPGPLYCGAIGIVLLAHLPESEIDEYLSSVVLERLSDTTITDPAELRRALAEARREGYSVSENSMGQGGASVAAPIFDHAGQVVAALSVAAPLENWRSIRDRARSLTVTGATEVSIQLGFGCFASDGVPPRFPVQS